MSINHFGSLYGETKRAFLFFQSVLVFRVLLPCLHYARISAHILRVDIKHVNS
jgi:hypothetical protein